MEGQHFIEIVSWAIILVCLVLVFTMQYRTFGASGKTRTIDNISSFFEINEIVDKWQRAVFATVASIPLSFVFLIVAYRAETFVEALMKSYGVDEKGIADSEADLAPFVEELIKNIPEPLLPIAILVFLFLVFGAQTKFLFLKIEKGIVFLTAIPQRTNLLSRNLSKHLLERQQYHKIVEELERSRKNKLPLAEELEEASNELKLSFQLLHIAKSDVRELGLREALRQIVDRQLPSFNKSDSTPETKYLWERNTGLLASGITGLNWFHIFASMMMFIIICGLYVGIAPSASKFFEARNIEWPRYASIGSLVHGVVQMVLATVLPMIIGIFLFVRRAEMKKETVVQTVTVVFVIVFLSSLVINAPFVFQQRLEIFLGIGELKSTSEPGFGGRAELFYVFVHSLIPCLVVLVIAIVDPEETLSVWDIVIAVVLVTSGHFLAYVAFELVADAQWGFYWHQALLSIVLATSALVILRIFWKTPLQPRDKESSNLKA